MAYDVAAQELLLFATRVQPGVWQAETWVWNGTTWLQQHPQHSPRPRTDAGMTYDSIRRVVVLFGGHTAPMSYDTPALNDTWTWDGKDWAQQQPATSPSPRAAPLVFDGALQEAILLGGSTTTPDQYREMWAWNGSTWTELAATLPAGWSSAAAVYDDAKASIVALPCSSTGPVPTLVFDGSAWHESSSGTLHTCKPAFVYDAKRSEAVLLGGNSGQISASTWTWDGTKWNLKSPAHNPPPRFLAMGEFDSATNQVVIFGGEGPFGAQNVVDLSDTWAWDGSDWSQVGT